MLDHDSGNARIIELLNILGGKLIASEKERARMGNTIEEFRHLIYDLSSRADQQERAFLTFDDKLGKTEDELQSLYKKYKTFIDTYQGKIEKIDRASDLMDQIEAALQEQQRINARLDDVSQERKLIASQLSSIESSIEKTNTAITEKALLVSKKNKLPEADNDNQARKKSGGWLKPNSTFQAAAMTGIFALAIWGGWAANESGLSGVIPKIKITGLSSSSLPSFNLPQSSSSDAYAKIDTGTSGQDNNAGEQNIVQITPAEQQTDQDDDMTAAAERLSEISPAAGTPDQKIEDTKNIQQQKAQQATTKSVTEDESVAKQSAFNLDAFLDSEKSGAPLAQTITPDEDLPAVIKEIEKKAFEGVATAQHDLGVIYSAGHGNIDIQYDRAFQWFKEAAFQNVANARYNLGVLYHQGLGIPQSMEKALGWYKAASALGHADALYNLGIASIEGIGTEYNPFEAVSYFEQSANGGVMEAAYNLGLIHENGLLGQADNDKAIYWYKVAAERNSEEASTALSQLSKRLGYDEARINEIYTTHTPKTVANDAKKQDTPAKIIKSTAKQNLNPEDFVAPSVDNNATTGTKAQKEVDRKSSLILNVQKELIDLGYHPGPANGVPDLKTEDAIRAYQSAHNMSQDGSVSDFLLKRLQEARNEVGSREE